MSAEYATAPPVSANSDTASTHTRLSGRSLCFARVVWAVLVVLTLVVYLASLPARWNELHTISPSRPDTNFWTGFLTPLTPEDADFLTQLGLSVDFYAVYAIGLSVAVAMGFIATGIILVWRRSHDWLALFVSLVFIACAAFFPPSIPGLLALQREQPAWSLLVAFIISLGFGISGIMWGIFPDGRFVPRWARWMAVLWTAWVIAWMVFPEISIVRASPQSLLIELAIPEFLFITQVYRYRRVSNRVQRQQTKWLVLCLIVVTPILEGGLVISAIFPSLSQPGIPNILYRLVNAPFFAINYLTVPFGVTLAVLRYRLWEVDLPINRSLVYGLVTLLLFAFFFILFWVSQAVLRLVLGSDQHGAAGIIATAITILLFNPTRKRIQNLIDRHVYGFRFDLNELAQAQRIPEIKNPGALSGKTLGKYQVLGVLGKGGMGEVYQGQADGRTVAIKILPDDLAEQGEFRKRFEREAQALAAFDHPNIVKIFGTGQSDGVYYMALEYIEGRDLSTLIHERGRIPLDEVRPFLADFAAALDYAHGHGLVHRDIKPSNIMLRASTPQPEAVLMDFGIAKLQDARTSLTGTSAIGTIDYMAPEQMMAAADVDQRADIYALGIVLYEMLTGERPFKGSAAQVMFAHLQQPPPDPRTLNSDLSPSVAHAIMQAMAKKPDDRFATASEFAAAL